MKNLKKLSKQELKTITGGRINCMENIVCPNYPCELTCTKISKNCAQEECRPDYTGNL